jgi:repressor LexA
MSANTRKRVLEAIKQYIAEHGYSPSTIELAKMLDLASPSTINHHLRSLEQDGLIRRTEGVARSIVVINQEEYNADRTGTGT